MPTRAVPTGMAHVHRHVGQGPLDSFVGRCQLTCFGRPHVHSAECTPHGNAAIFPSQPARAWVGTVAPYKAYLAAIAASSPAREGRRRGSSGQEGCIASHLLPCLQQGWSTPPRRKGRKSGQLRHLREHTAEAANSVRCNLCFAGRGPQLSGFAQGAPALLLAIRVDSKLTTAVTIYTSRTALRVHCMQGTPLRVVQSPLPRSSVLTELV